MDKTDITLKLLAKTYSSDQIHDQVPFQILIDMYLKVAQSPLFLFYWLINDLLHLTENFL